MKIERTIKKSISILLIAVIGIAFSVPVCVNNVYASSNTDIMYFSALSDSGNQEKEITIKWGWDILGCCVKSNNCKYHRDIAIAGLSLSAAAEASSDRVEYILENQLEFNKGAWSTEYDKAFLDQLETSQPGRTFAYKRTKINGKMTNVFAVVIRGTANTSDKLTDLRSWSMGFYTSAENVMKDLEWYMASCRGKAVTKVKKENNIFLVTGHSLGASVANILATDIVAKKYAGKSNTLSYTFAAPKTADSGTAKKFPMFFNFVNDEDIVPNLSQKGSIYGGYYNWKRSDYEPEVSYEFHKICSKDLDKLMQSDSIGTAHACDTYMAFLKMLYRLNNDTFVYRSQSVMSTTGGGPGGNDYPNYTSINGRNVYLDYDDDGSEVSVLIDGKKHLIAQTTDYSINLVVSNGTAFYYSVYNWDSGKYEFYEASTYQKSKKLYSTKKEMYMVGYYGGDLYFALHKGNYYNKSKNRWIFKYDLIKMNASTKKISTVKKGFNPQQSYGQYIICEKETDSYVNDFNARYIYNAATGKITKLPVNDAYTIATPECVVSYQYSDGSIVRCDYNGKNKTVMLDNIDRALWIDDNKACVTLSEEDYLDGITYIFDYETGKLSRGSGIW